MQNKFSFLAYVFIFCSFLSPSFSFAEKKKITREEYIKKFTKICKKESKKNGIPASIKMAQAILESNGGNSELSRKSNNHFGIKCHKNWKGKKVHHDDDEAQECFRKYKNPFTSFRDHSIFLQKARYQNLFLLDKRNYVSWAEGLREAGYATNPQYSKRLIDVIEKYELYKLEGGKKQNVEEHKKTIEPPIPTPTVSPAKTPVVLTENKTEEIPKVSEKKEPETNDTLPSHTEKQKTTQETLSIPFSFSSPMTYFKPISTLNSIEIEEGITIENQLFSVSNTPIVVPRIKEIGVFDTLSEKKKQELYAYLLSKGITKNRIRKNNGIKFISALPGETFRMIASAFNIPENNIFIFNDLKVNSREPLEGELVYIEPKKMRNGSEEKYTVLVGETVWSVSQVLGVKKNILVRRNLLEKSSPKILKGETLWINKKKDIVGYKK